MKSLNISKNKGRVFSLKLLALACMLGASFTITHYVSQKDYVSSRQETVLKVNALSENITGSMISLKQGNAVNISNLVSNADKLTKNIDLLYQPNNGLTNIVVQDSLLDESKGTLDNLKASADNLNDSISNIKDNISLYSELPAQKENLKKELINANQQIRILFGNGSVSGDTKTILTNIYTALNQLTIFDRGNLFSTEQENLAAQNRLLTTLSNNLKDLNALSNSMSNGKLNGNVIKLLSSVNNMVLIANDLNKVEQINVEFNDAKKIALINSNINKYSEQIKEKQMKYLASLDIWFYISAVLVLILLLIIIVELVQNESGTRKTSSRNSRAQKVLKNAIKELEKNLSLVLRDQDKTISRNGFNQVFGKQTPVDNNTYSIKNKVEKIMAIFFSIVDKTTEKSENMEKINNNVIERTDSMKSSVLHHKETMLELENLSTKIINTLNYLENGASKSAKFSESIENKIKEIDLISNQIRLKMRSIRDKSQDTSKKIKRMSESSQSTGELTDSIRDNASKIEVLALDIAIDSSTSHTENRRMSVISKEIQRLANSVRSEAKRIDDAMTLIKEDSKGTVTSMEKNTLEIVDGDELMDTAGKLLRKVSEEMAIMKQEAKGMNERTSNNKTETSDLRQYVSNLKKYMQEYLYFMEDLNIWSSSHMSDEINALQNEVSRKINSGEFNNDD